jgi:hypothetical protein
MSIGHKAVVALHEDVCSIFNTDTVFGEMIPADARLFVDTTASSAVLSAMVGSQSLASSGVRLVRASLYSRGRVAAVMLESPGRTVRVDDLIAGLFARAVSDDALRRALAREGLGLSPVFVGQNCRSMTMQMPDSLLSRGASMIAVQLEKWLTTELPPVGVLALGIEDDMGIGCRWTSETVQPTLSLRHQRWEVRVLASVVERIHEDAIHWGASETGGGLLGAVSHETRTIVVCGLLAAPPDSKRSSSEFVLGTEGLVDQVRRASDASLGYMAFVGTWHSHPMGGRHSPLDLSTLLKLALQSRGAPIVSLVWKPEGYSVEVGQAYFD